MVGHADINGHDCIKRVYHPNGKSATMNACTGGQKAREAGDLTK